MSDDKKPGLFGRLFRGKSEPAAPGSEPAAVEPTVDNSGLPVLPGVTGQTAAQYTCSIANE